ncbi:MAG: TetR/AcrR family transcriptional regulator [Solirubrobacterales bacterium]|nr:TetR/AcrR family transcriptional regulator [Solirubrobacterales bacterium]
MVPKARSNRPGARGATRDTGQRILDSAERLVQQRGFNAFSYADIAGELGVTKASLHYHFPGKGELGEALITRYAERFARALEEIESNGGDAAAKLTEYANLYAGALRGQRMCLCGMLAAEYQTLPEPVRSAVVAFFDHNEDWLESVLDKGRRDNTLAFVGSPRDTARMIIGGLEGAMLVARPYGDLARFQSAATTLVASLATKRERGDWMKSAALNPTRPTRSRPRRQPTT